MKKVSVFLIIVLLLGFTVSASANSSTEYYIDECGIRVQMPDDYNVITKNTKENDPVVAELGLSFDEVQSYFSDGVSYLYAFNKTYPYMMIISMDSADDDTDFRRYSNSELLEIFGSQSSVDEENGLSIDNQWVYEHEQTKFIVHDYTDLTENPPWNIEQYATAVNGDYYFIKMITNAGSFPDDYKQSLMGVVQSIVFDSISSEGSGEPTNSRSATSTQRSSDSNLMMIFYILLGIAALILLAYLFLRKSSKKNQSYSSGEIYNQPFENDPVTGTHPHSVPLSEKLPTSESILAHEDSEENKVTDADIKPAEYILCPNCSERLKSDAVFCPFCGTRLSKPDFEADDYEPTIRAD